MLLDAPSLVYRAFFALPKTIVDADGRSVNAARGFMDMVAWLVGEWHPDAVVCAFDADWRPAWRVEAFAGYKSERAEDPPELPWQFDLLEYVLDAAGLPRAEAAGLEADDVLATLVETLDADDRAWIVSGDRDLLCLVRDPQVRLLFPVKGVKQMTEFDAAAVEAKYGVPPDRYAEFAMLRGDSSDGLPGVAGVGPVRAAALLREYGSIAGIFSALDELPPKQRAAFESAAGYLEAVRPVVTLVTDAALKTTTAHPPEEQELRELAEAHNLGSSATRLGRAVRELSA